MQGTEKASRKARIREPRHTLRASDVSRGTITLLFSTLEKMIIRTKTVPSQSQIFIESSKIV